MDNKDIKLLEAILFASGEPIEEADLKDKIIYKRYQEEMKEVLI